MVDRVGFQPTASCLRGRRSEQLSYRSKSQTLTGLVGVEPDDLSIDSAAATPLAHSPFEG